MSALISGGGAQTTALISIFFPTRFITIPAFRYVIGWCYREVRDMIGYSFRLA